MDTRQCGQRVRSYAQILIKELQLTCFYCFIASVCKLTRAKRPSGDVDFLSIDRRHLFHAIAAVSNFPFAIAMVLHGRFALLNP
jgi:hypothetical protein